MSNKKAIDELLKQSNETIHKITVENIKKQTAFLENFVKNSHNIDVKIHKMRKDEYSKLINLEYDFINNKKKIAYEKYKDEIETLSLQKEQNKKQLEEHKKHLYDMYKAQGRSDEYIADKIKKSVADSEKYYKEEIDKLQKNIDKYKIKYRKEREVLKKFEKNTSALTRAMNMVGGSVDRMGNNSKIINTSIDKIGTGTSKFKTILGDFENAFDSQLKKSSPMLAYFKKLLFNKENKKENDINKILKKGTNIDSKKSKVSSPKNGQEQVKGRYSDKEIAYIKKKYKDVKSIPKIASGLNRPEKSVKIKIKNMKEKGELRDVERVNPFSMFKTGFKKLGGVFKTGFLSLGTKLNKLKSIEMLGLLPLLKMVGIVGTAIASWGGYKYLKKKFVDDYKAPTGASITGVESDNFKETYSKVEKYEPNEKHRTKVLRKLVTLKSKFAKNKHNIAYEKDGIGGGNQLHIDQLEAEQQKIIDEISKINNEYTKDNLKNINNPEFKNKHKGIRFKKRTLKNGNIRSRAFKLNQDVLKDNNSQNVLKMLGNRGYTITETTKGSHEKSKSGIDHINGYKADVRTYDKDASELLKMVGYINKQDIRVAYEYKADDPNQRVKALALLNAGYKIHPHISNGKKDTATTKHLNKIRGIDKLNDKKLVLNTTTVKGDWKKWGSHLDINFGKHSNGDLNRHFVDNRQKQIKQQSQPSAVGKKIQENESVRDSITNDIKNKVNLHKQNSTQNINNTSISKGGSNVALTNAVSGLVDVLERKLLPSGEIQLV